MVKAIVLTPIIAVLAVAAAGIYKFEYLANQPDYGHDGNALITNKLHPDWDADNDGMNDCENDGSCDHTTDYSLPRKTGFDL